MKSVITLLLFIISLNLQAQTWKKAELQIDLPEMNNLEFKNRAACAADSKNPTKSIFILVDNLNLGKTLYKYAKNEGLDSSTFTTNGIKTYRKVIIGAINLITSKIVARKLPLLPVDTSHYLTPERYKEISTSCYQQDQCLELEKYLISLWETSNKKFLNHVPRFQKIDSFNEKYHFLKDGVVKNKQVGCYQLKKFSAIEAHLYGGKPTHEAIKELSSALINSKDYLSSCDHDGPMPSLKVATYQWDVLIQDGDEWNRRGFDFWNSVKLYLNLLMKNPAYLNTVAGDYSFIFPAVSLSETVVLASNGCASLSPPACSLDFLSKNSMRIFAQDEFKNSMNELELMKQVTSSIAEDILRTPIVDVNRDILDLKNYEMANQWTENFFDNFSKTKGFFKLRLLNSSKNLFYISQRSIEDFSSKLDSEIRDIKSNEETRRSLYHLCAEYYIGGHEKLSFLKQDLNELSQNGQLKDILSFNTNYSLDHILGHLNSIRDIVINRCNQLEKDKIWEEDLTINRSDYKRWYRQEVYQEKPIPFDDSDPSFFKTSKGYITISGHNGVEKNEISICGSASECARTYLADIFRLRAVSNYLTALVPGSGQVTDTNLFNPYAERVACKVYDPWRKTKASMFQFFGDLTQAGVSVINPMPVYVSATIDLKSPVSFSSLVKDGKVFYDPKFDKDKLHASLMIDLGAIAGIPCLISISDTKQPPVTFYQFNGININACNSQVKNTTTVNDASSIKNGSSSHSECFTCSISLATSLKQVTSAVPVIRPFAFFARAIINLYQNMSDPENVPRRWEINPFYVHETFRKYGEIPKSCVKSLSRGDICLDNRCEEVAAKAVYQNFSTFIESITVDPYGQETLIKTSSCNQEIKLLTDLSLSGCQARLRSYTQEDFSLPQSCDLGRKK